MNITELQSRLSLPVISAPMFLVSGADLVLAACKSGVLGTFPALNARTSEDFEQMLRTITTELQRHAEQTGKPPAPFGVNLIVHKTNTRLEADIKLCAQYRVPLIITSLGAVRQVVDAVHGFGSLVFHDVIKKRHAEKAAEAGVDGIIAVTAGAGGHAGSANPFALIAEIRSFFKGTLALAGALSTGRDIAAARILGADFAYMGTRFLATKESQASADYKNMILSAGVEDIFYTDSVSGVSANFLSASLQRAGVDLSHKGEEDFSKLQASGGGKAWRDIWSAGHGVAAIHSVPSVAELVQELRADYRAALERAAQWK